MNTTMNTPNMRKNGGYPQHLMNLEQQIVNTENMIKNARSGNKQGAGINMTNLTAKLVDLEQKYRNGLKKYLG